MSGEQRRPSREEVTRETPLRHGWGGVSEERDRALREKREDALEKSLLDPDIIKQKFG